MRKNLIHCPAIVYIQGEEMTRHVMKTFVDKCIQPHVDTSSWDFFDMTHGLKVSVKKSAFQASFS